MPDGAATIGRRRRGRGGGTRRRRPAGPAASAGASSRGAAGTTLLVLVVLGVALYFIAARTLERRGARAQLDDRGSSRAPAAIPARTPDERRRSASSSEAAARARSRSFSTPTATAIGPRQLPPPRRPARTTDVARQRPCGSDRDVRPAIVATTPVRILTEPVETNRDGLRPGHPGPDGRAADARRAPRASCSSAAPSSSSWRSASGRSTPGGPSSRSASRSPPSARRSAASASSRPTPATSCGRR